MAAELRQWPSYGTAFRVCVSPTTDYHVEVRDHLIDVVPVSRGVIAAPLDESERAGGRVHWVVCCAAPTGGGPTRNVMLCAYGECYLHDRRR